MNLAELNACLNPRISCENELLSSIFKILEACESSQNMMIGIYLLERDYFLYINRRLKKLIGRNGIKLFLEGWKYWFSIIDPDEVFTVKKKVTDHLFSPFNQVFPTLYYHINNLEGRYFCLKHEVVLHNIERETLVINYLFDVSDKERIEHCLEDISVSHSNKQHLNISAREKEILLLISNGFSSKEIADKLYISNHTAISHRKNLIEKFKVKNTAHLIKRATELIIL